VNQTPAPPPPASTTPPPAAPPATKPPTPPPGATPPSAPSNPAPPAATAPSQPSAPSTPDRGAEPPAAAPDADTPAYAKLFSSGRSPVRAEAFDPNKTGAMRASSLSKVLDGDGSTIWKSGAFANGIGSGAGFYVDDGASGKIRGLGLLAKTPGFDIQVYAYNGDNPPPSLSGWTLLGSQTNVSQRQQVKLDLKGQEYQLYLVWFTKLPAKGQRFEIPEVQILP
jgi:hypothetical protein